MTRANQQVPSDPDDKAEREAVRDVRRAEALRANLKRRKAQLRARANHARQVEQDSNGSTEPAKDGP